MSIGASEDEVLLTLKPEDKDKKVSFEIGYLVPFWSSKPIHKYSLEIWREGAILNTVDISGKEYYLIGRNKTICDIYINNITVSRVHCVLQHKDDGELYIYDMDSVYGTMINKKQITKKNYTKLNVGDTFKLGKSGKMFIVNGPAELLPQEDDRPLNFVDKKELMQKRAQQIKEQYELREKYKRNLLGLDKEEVDWGQRDYDDEIRKNQKEDDDSDKEHCNDYYGPLKLEEIKQRKDLSEKQKNQIEKMEGIMKAINKLKDEIIKIKKKEFESGELTEGQMKRVEINEKKLENLYEKYELSEENLRISLTSKDGIGLAEQKFDKKFAKEINSDEDEFFDRAKVNNNSNYQGNKKIVVTENYETLKNKLEVQMRTRQKLVDKLQKFDSDKSIDKDEEIDTLDAYFNETQNKIKSDQKLYLTQQIADLNKEISKTQKFISLVTPSHIKIKFKSEDEIQKQSLFQQNSRKNRENTDYEGDEETNALGIKRDQEALDKEKKHKKNTSVLDVFNKMNQKINIEAAKKFTDSDEEILDEVKLFKENIGKEMEEDFKHLRQEFLKVAMKPIDPKDSENPVKKGGLITTSDKKQESTGNTYFEEIIDNINQEDFDVEKYSEINKILTRKNEEKWEKRNDTGEIDYSTGGLQTFEKKPKGYGLILNSTSSNVNDEEDYFYEDENGNVYEDRNNEELLKKKRERENPYLDLGKKKIYSVTQKPKSRNVNEEDLDEQDYETFHLPMDKYKIEFDINNSNPYKRDDNE